MVETKRNERDDMGGNISENLGLSEVQRRIEVKRDLKFGQFTLIELPVLQIPGEIEIRRISRELTESPPPILKRLSAKERMNGDVFNDLVKNSLLKEVSQNYPNLNSFAMDFYFDSLLREKIYPWNFSGTVAVEKILPGLSSISDREGMSLMEINGFISRNREEILERILIDNPTIERTDMSSVELRLPTIAEMIALDGLGQKSLSSKPIWTDTQRVLGGQKEKVNLIWRPKAYLNEEIDCINPDKIYMGAEFIIIAKLNKPVSRSGS